MLLDDKMKEINRIITTEDSPESVVQLMKVVLPIVEGTHSALRFGNRRKHLSDIV